MSPKSVRRKPDDELSAVLWPRIPRPPAHEVEAAKRDIPKVLAEDGRNFASFGVSTPTLAQWLREGWSHSRNAAEWAIADSIADGFLRPAAIDPRPKDWEAHRHFQVYPTSALWDWWAARTTATAPDTAGLKLSPGKAALKGPALAAFKIIKARKGKGIAGKEIVRELEKQGIEVTVGAFRRHIVPQLKADGVLNEHSRGGYYLP